MRKLLDNIKYIKDCKTIYDIGAHVGKWTQMMSANLKKTNFVMFDAYPEHKNLHAPARFPYFNVALYKEDDAELKFFVNKKSHHTTGNSFYKENTTNYNEDDFINVKTKKLDTIISEQNLDLPDVIKLDTQGAELDILLGATEALKYAKIVQCEMSIYPYNKDGVKFSAVNDYLIDQGFLPIGFEDINYSANVLLQVDMVYMKRSLNELYFPFSKNLK